MNKLTTFLSAAADFFRRRFLVSSLLIINLILLLCLIYQRYENDAALGKWHINDFVGKKFVILEEFSTEVEFENLGKLKFTPVKTGNYYPDQLEFYLLNKRGNIEYQFPDFFANMWILWELDDINFLDLNHDDKTDILIFARYMVGAGDNSGREFPTASIYFQMDDGFVNLNHFEDNLHFTLEDKSRESVLDYIENNQNEIALEFDKTVIKDNRRLEAGKIVTSARINP